MTKNHPLFFIGENICIFPSYYSKLADCTIAEHRTRMLAAWNVLAARNVKSTMSAGLIGVNVTTAGLNVPGAKAGMFTTALTGAPTSVSDCKPVPAFT